MINVDGNSIEYKYMGFFTTDEEWIHPEITENTYEIIYVTDGNVYLFEGNEEYALSENDLIILKPGTLHGGSKRSYGRTSFYWLHFLFDGDNIPHPSRIIRNFMNYSIFKEMLHHSCNPNSSVYIKEGCLLHILALISESEHRMPTGSTLSHNIFEWTRINAQSGLTVQRIAEHFRYNSEYISRIIKNEYGMSLKSLIDRFIIDKAKSYLANSDYSIKEIASLLGFSQLNTFINFFKYHEKTSPTKYKNRYICTHMNKR